ncbi:T9SS type A sorting domain-containing protein [candidate division WOR-3 bacterium]|nr:T9SS type A sorting domain-containing protein [candidate division WOR-3 bacterium]
MPVSRVIVRRRSDSGIFMMGSPGEDMMPIEIPFCLYQPFPNPFGNAATIRYSLPYATHVSLKVYDVSGRLVNNLVDREVQAGVHQLQWTGKDDLNRKCASGVYFVRFAADDYTASKKMVLVK